MIIFQFQNGTSITYVCSTHVKPTKLQNLRSTYDGFGYYYMNCKLKLKFIYLLHYKVHFLKKEYTSSYFMVLVTRSTLQNLLN